MDLSDRDKIISLLDAYSQFLEEGGYIDIDYKTEPPFAIDEFMKLLEYGKPGYHLLRVKLGLPEK